MQEEIKMKKFLLGMALAAATFGTAALADAYPGPAPVPHRSYDATYSGDYSGYNPSNYVSRRMTLHLSYRDADGLYEGEVNSRGIPDGHGRFTTTYADDANRWRYEGEFRDGHFEGHGRISDLDTNRAWHEGNFTNDELTGYGTLGQNGRVIWEGYFLKDIPLEDERPLPNPVRYVNWEFSISDIYEDSRLGNTRADGRYIIVLTKVRNLTNLYVRSIASPGLVRLWDKRNGNTYKVDTDAMKRYYREYGSAYWMTDRMPPYGRLDTVALAFDIPDYVDNDDLALVFYAGSATIGYPYSINIR